MTASVHGSCLCQSVKYEFEGPVQVFQYCHCSRCRKTSGSAFSPNLLVAPEQFRWLAGEDLVGRFEHPDARHFATSFCTRCGSNLPWLSQTGRAVIIPAGTLDEDPGIRPTQNIFFGSGAPWREAVDDLPQHEELPPREPAD